MPTAFTPIASLLGGVLIGIATLILWMGLGRIAGVSGIFGTTLRISTTAHERVWRLTFLAGLIAGSALAGAFAARQLVWPSPVSATVLWIAGLAVGVGTGMARGCTSGHGVCGLARLSRRSIVATAVFMALGFLTASVLRHLW